MSKRKEEDSRVPVQLTTDITLKNVNFKAGATVAVDEQTAAWLIAQNSAKRIKQAQDAEAEE